MEDHLIKLICFTLSCSCSVTVTSSFLAFYIKFGQIKNNFASQLILILAISDLFCWGQLLITNLYLLISGEQINSFDPSLCIYIAYFQNLSSFITLVTVFLISFSIYLSTVKNIVITKYRFKLCLAAVFFVFIFSSLPFFTSDYGQTDTVICWIVGKPMKFFSYYFIILLIGLIDFYCIIKALHVIKKLPILPLMKTKLRRHLILFPLIFLFTFAAGFFNSTLNFFRPDSRIPWLEALDFLLEPMDGVLNPLAYMLINEQVQQGIKKFFDCSRKSSEHSSKTALFSDEERCPSNILTNDDNSRIQEQKSLL